MDRPPSDLQIMPLRAKPYALSVLTLFIANASFLVLFLVFDLTLFQVAAVYWWECLWIGIFSALKPLVASVLADPYDNRWVQFSRGSRVLTSIVAIVFVSADLPPFSWCSGESWCSRFMALRAWTRSSS